MHTSLMTQAVFDADLDRMNAKIEEFGAVITFDDGFQGIDETKVPAGLLSAYSGLLSYGYANSLI